MNGFQAIFGLKTAKIDMDVLDGSKSGAANLVKNASRGAGSHFVLIV